MRLFVLCMAEGISPGELESRRWIRVEGKVVHVVPISERFDYFTAPGRNRKVIKNEHIKNIYDECELLPESTIRKFRIVRTESNRPVSRTVDFYNLDVIISVGYRVCSHRGTQLRKWATEYMREYIIKGFTLDDERLSEPGGIKYFDELLDRIRTIWLSPRSSPRAQGAPR